MTKTIPIVLGAAGAPVETGLVSSLAKPGGNVTGLSNLSALSEVARVLKPQACFVMLTSSFPWLWSMHDVANDHRRRYYLRDIEEKVSASHFQIVRLSHLNFFALPFLSVILVLHRLMYGLRPERSHRILPVPPKPVNFILTQLLALEGSLMKWVRLPWGVSMIGAFRKQSSVTP